jgi:hypothetical protein
MQHDAHVWAFRCRCWLNQIWMYQMFKGAGLVDFDYRGT